jgi:hypothetical protein
VAGGELAVRAAGGRGGSVVRSTFGADETRLGHLLGSARDFVRSVRLLRWARSGRSSYVVGGPEVAIVEVLPSGEYRISLSCGHSLRTDRQPAVMVGDDCQCPCGPCGGRR